MPLEQQLDSLPLPRASPPISCLKQHENLYSPGSPLPPNSLKKDALTIMIEDYLINNIACLAENIAKELRGQLPAVVEASEQQLPPFNQEGVKLPSPKTLDFHSNLRTRKNKKDQDTTAYKISENQQTADSVSCKQLTIKCDAGQHKDKKGIHFEMSISRYFELLLLNA